MAKFYFLVILVGLVSCGVFDFNGTFEDYFLYTAQNQLDHSVDPCDDFYRHYGFIGRVLGHEMMHSFFTDYMFERSELVGEKALCTMRHINRVNKAFKVDVGEKRPYHSYMEDTADHEGTKIAYKAFLEEFGDTKAENIAAGVNITNQQMFFYALAAGKCDPNETTVKDNYSPKHIRVNGAVSLVNGFHETFKCKDDDRMKRIANGESCNLLGNLVR